MKRFLLISALLCINVHIITSKQTKPTRFRELIDNTEYIVVATIINNTLPQYTYYTNSVGDTTLKDKLINDDTVTLVIAQSLKGTVNDSIRVVFSPGSVCPGSAEFPDKMTVIAFLSKDKKTGLFYVDYGLRGSKIMANDSELVAYRDRITEYINIQKQEGSIDLIEWNVKCIESTWTRWEAIGELRRDKVKNGRITKVYLDKGFYRHLNRRQKDRIDQALFNTTSIGYEELLLMDYVSKSKYSQLKDFMLTQLEAGSDSYTDYTIMDRYVELFPDIQLQTIVDQAGELKKNDPQEPILKSQFLSIARQNKK